MRFGPVQQVCTVRISGRDSEAIRPRHHAWPRVFETRQRTSPSRRERSRVIQARPEKTRRKPYASDRDQDAIVRRIKGLSIVLVGIVDCDLHASPDADVAGVRRGMALPCRLRFSRSFPIAEIAAD